MLTSVLAMMLTVGIVLRGWDKLIRNHTMCVSSEILPELSQCLMIEIGDYIKHYDTNNLSGSLPFKGKAALPATWLYVFFFYLPLLKEKINKQKQLSFNCS